MFGFFAHPNPNQLYVKLSDALVEAGYGAPIKQGYKNTHTLVNICFRGDSKAEGIAQLNHRVKLYNKTIQNLESASVKQSTSMGLKKLIVE